MIYWTKWEAKISVRIFNYRLAVMRFVASPLRDRPKDILPLARRFIALHCENMRRPAPSLTPEAEATLLQYHWPGNVRELENVIERALAFDQGEEITAESLIFDARWKAQPVIGRAYPDSQEHSEAMIPAGVKFDDLALHEKRKLIKWALRQSHGKREDAAKLLGLPSRYKLLRRMKKLGIGNVDKD